MHSFIFSEVNACKAGLHSVDAWRCLELFKEGNAGCRCFGFLYTKPTSSEAEIGVELVEHAGEDAARIRVIFQITAIHENILFPAMTVQVAKENEVSLSLDLLAQLFDTVHGWVQDV